MQSVNSYHERLKSWILRGLRGVATRHLPNYLSWQRLRTWNGGLDARQYLASAMGVQVTNA